MNRRQMIGGLAGLAAIVTTGTLVAVARSQDERFKREQELNTFTENDTLLERLDKLNALMGTDYHLVIHRSARQARERHRPTKELLKATSKTLMNDGNFQCSVYLTRNGRQWTGHMVPVEYLHWTAQVALGYRLAKAEVS